MQESRARESLYREKLSAALEENRVQHAEISELRRQSCSDAALAQSWRSASKETELSLSSYEASLRIAREEVSMLEHTLKRLEDENVRLKEALRYADKIVYGEKGGSNAKLKAVKKTTGISVSIAVMMIFHSAIYALGTPAKRGGARAWVPNGTSVTNKENPDVNRRSVDSSAHWGAR